MDERINHGRCNCAGVENIFLIFLWSGQALIEHEAGILGCPFFRPDFYVERNSLRDVGKPPQKGGHHANNQYVFRHFGSDHVRG
jgi:hypothetical protein